MSVSQGDEDGKPKFPSSAAAARLEDEDEYGDLPPPMPPPSSLPLQKINREERDNKGDKGGKGDLRLKEKVHIFEKEEKGDKEKGEKGEKGDKDYYDEEDDSCDEEFHKQMRKYAKNMELNSHKIQDLEKQVSKLQKRMTYHEGSLKQMEKLCYQTTLGLRGIAFDPNTNKFLEEDERWQIVETAMLEAKAIERSSDIRQVSDAGTMTYVSMRTTATARQALKKWRSAKAKDEATTVDGRDYYMRFQQLSGDISRMLQLPLWAANTAMKHQGYDTQVKQDQLRIHDRTTNEIIVIIEHTTHGEVEVKIPGDDFDDIMVEFSDAWTEANEWSMIPYADMYPFEIIFQEIRVEDLMKAKGKGKGKGKKGKERSRSRTRSRWQEEEKEGSWENWKKENKNQGSRGAAETINVEEEEE
jgi:hypothetical protein